MGNIGSQTGHISQKHEPEPKWANSYPRNPPPPRLYHHHKVLPERDNTQKLRHTNNGEILHNGGTLSGRLFAHKKQDNGYNPSLLDTQSAIPRPQKYRRNTTDDYKSFHKKFGSEPDLRDAKTGKGKKKYKAPEPPRNQQEWDDPERTSIRKARLYKTRVETKKKYSSPVDNSELNDVQLRHHHKTTDRTNRLSLPEMRRSQSMPEFQQELKEVTERIKESSEDKLKTLDPILTKTDVVKHQIQEQIAKTAADKPPKTFYFGMNGDQNTLDYHPSSASDLSSELDMDDCPQNTDGIALQLRPILPKKQLEIPRFSPAAAWRQLSSIESNNAGSTEASEEGSVLIENRIEKYSRPPPPALQIGRRSNHDKSGDSGISGDAPPIFEEGPESLPNLRIAGVSKSRGLSWTPQQDLGDDSSNEEGINLESANCKIRGTSKPHVFSLSLPRDNLGAYVGDSYTAQSYNKGMQKIKRSVSGVLSNLGSKKVQPTVAQETNENWFLSKSAPNSLNNGFNSLDTDNTSLLAAASKQNTGRVMYLPEISRKNGLSKSVENVAYDVKSSSEPEDLQDAPRHEIDVPQWRKPKKFTFQSTVRQIERRKLAEKLSREAEKKEQQRLRELEAMQRVEEEFQRKRAREKASIRQQLRMFSLDETSWSGVAPKLEVKENLAPRPEPDGAASSSTPSPSFRVEKPHRKFSEFTKTNGKYLSSSESSEEHVIKPLATQVLSEYRQPQREYKDYRGSKRYIKDETLGVRQTVHPQVTCNMPKVNTHSGVSQNGGNYRKIFAHGVRSSRSADSTYSEDSRGHSPKMYRSGHAPITRF